MSVLDDGQPLQTQLRRTRKFKLIYLVLGLQISLLAGLYYTMYPLDFAEISTVRAVGYLILMGTMALTATLLAYYGRSAASSFLATAVFYVALNSHQVLYYSVTGGDTTGEIVDLAFMSQLTQLGPDGSPAFSYLTYPMNYLFGLVLQRTYELGGVVETVSVGYWAYFFVLVVAVWLFAFRFGDGFAAYVGASAYLVLSFTVLNNQFVPQLFALVILFFLFYMMDRDGVGWRVVEFGLFVPLVFAHPVFPVFYPLALTLRPGIRSLRDQYRNDPRVSRSTDVVRHPLVLLGRLFSVETWITGSRRVYARAFLLWAIYFVKNPPWYIRDDLLTVGEETAGNPVLDILARILPFDLLSSVFPSAEPVSGDAETVFLYEIVPRWVNTVTTWGSRVVVVGLFAVLLLALFYTDISNRSELTSGRDTTERIADYRLEILVASAAFFAVTVALNSTYGMRALQVAFLPVGLFFYGMRKHRKPVVLIVICLVLVSPVLVANTAVNNSLTAGGTTIGYDETQAGLTIEDYSDRDDVVVPPGTPYPVGTLENPRVIDLQHLVDGIASEPESGLLVYSDRISYYLEYRGRDCEIATGSGDAVYDNGDVVVLQPAGGKMSGCL